MGHGGWKDAWLVMDPARFLIEILVKARADVDSAMTRAAASIDKVTKSTERQAASQAKATAVNEKTKRSVDDLHGSFADFTKELESGNKSLDDSTFHLKRFQSEFEKLARAQKPGSQIGEDLNRAAQAAKKLHEQLLAQDKERRRQIDESYRQAAEIDKSYADLERNRVDSERRAAENRKKFVADLVDHVRSGELEKQNITDDTARKSVVAAEKEVEQRRAITRKANADFSREMAVFFKERETLIQKASDFEISEAARVESMRATSRVDRDRLGLRQIGKDADDAKVRVGGFMGALQGLLKIDSSQMDRLRKTIADVDSGLDHGSYTAIRFAGTLRSLVYVGAFVFFQELTGAAVALGGALVSVASAAVQAGAALAGMAAAAASQAIPVIGLLGAAWGRVGAVFDAVKQAQKNLAQSAYDAAQAADRQKAAADAVRSAQEGLTAANERAAEAQDALNKARADGVRQVEDLVAAERRAQLQAESAALAQKDAQQAFSSALRTGNVGDLASKALQSRQSDLDLSGAHTALARARADADAAVSGGIEGLPGVVAARKAVTDAAKGVGDANHQLLEARRNAAQSVQQISTGTRELQQLLDQLSPAERRLYTALNGLYKRYLAVFVGDKNRTGILGGIIEAFTEGVGRVDDLLGDKRLVDTAKRLSDAIGTELRRAFKFLTGADNVSFLEGAADEARKNLPVIETIFENVLNIIRAIAQAGTPAFHEFVEFLEDLAKKGADATSSRSGISRLERFFSKGEEYAESITSLALAVGALFLAIIGGSAQEGQSALDAITDKIKEATGWINDHQQEVHQFFADAVKASGAIAVAAGALAKALFGLFQEEHVEAFAKAFTNTLLPALVTTAHVVGGLTQVILAFAGTGPGSAFLRFFITFALLSKVFGAFGGFILRFGREIALFFGREGLVGIFNTLLRTLGPVRIILAIIVGLIAVMNGKLPHLHDLLKAIAGTLALMLITTYGKAGLAGAFQLMLAGLERLGATSLVARLAPLGRFFSGMLENVKGLLSRLPGLRGRLGSAVPEAPIVLPGAGDRPGVVVPPGTRRVPIEGRSPGGVIPPRGAAGAAEAEAVAEGAAVGASRFILPAAAVIALVDFMTSNGTILNKLQQVASDFTFGIIPGPNVKQGRDPTTKSLRDKGILQPESDLTSALNRPDSFYNKLNPKSAFAVSPEQVLQGRIDSLNRYKDALEAAAKEESNAGKDDLAAHFQDLANRADSAAKKLQGLGDAINKIPGINVDDVLNPNSVRQFLSNLERMKTNGFTTLKALRDNVQFNVDQISTGLREGSASWVDAMAKNFEAATDIILKQTGGWTKATGAALREIRKLFAQELELYGISPSEARTLARNRTTAGRTDLNLNNGPEEGTRGLGRAVGGFVGKVGERGRDAYHTVLGRGEAVLNWAHQKFVDPALRATYGFGLGDMFKRVRGEHAGGGVSGGMSLGGVVGEDIFNGHPGNVNPFVAKLIKVMKRFPLSVTSTTDHSRLTTTGNVSDHSSGDAVDMAGDPDVMLRAANWIKSSGLYKRLKQGIHNPNLAVNAGKIQVPPGQFAGRTWAEHINHIHLAITGAIGKFSSATSGAMSRLLKKITVKGPGGGGILGVISQRVVDLARTAANRMLGGAGSGDPLGSDVDAPSVDSLIAGDDAGGLKAYNKRYPRHDLSNAKGRARFAPSLVARIAAWAGLPGKAFEQIAHGESNYFPGILGHDPGGTTGFGLWQITNRVNGPLFEKFVQQLGGWLEMLNPLKNARAARWLYDRGGLSHWSGTRYLDAQADRGAGGSFAAGGVVGGAVGKAMPIVAHAGEWVLNKIQQSKMASLMGIGVSKLRSLLGFTGGEGSYAGGTGDVRGYVEGSSVGSTPAVVDKEISRATRIIDGLKTRIINSKLTDSLSTSFAALLGDGGLFDQLDTAIQALTDKLSTNLNRAIYKIDKTGNVVQKLDAQGISDRTVANFQRVYSELAKQQVEIQDQLSDVAKRLSSKSISSGERAYLKSVQVNLSTRLIAIRQAVADNLASTFQAVEDSIQARVDKASSTEQSSTLAADLQERVRAIAGDAGSAVLGLPSAQQLAQVRATALGAQAAAVQAAADYARSKGHADTYASLVETVRDLQEQAVEAVQAGLRAAADDVDKAAGRAATAVGLRDRLAALREQAGDAAGAFSDRQSNLGLSRASILSQVGDLTSLQGQAMAQGQGAVWQELQDRIDELNVQLAENAAAIKENTVSARGAAIDAITQRSGFLGSVYSGLGGILSSLGSLGGNPDLAGQRTLLGLQRSNLTATGKGLADQLLGYGIDVRGMSPQEIASKLSATDFSAIESGLLHSDRAVFESLIASLISNTGALVDNTGELSTFDGSLVQTFSSTAWTMFRRAVFNGAGGLLPQYSFKVPSAASGALIRRGGLLEVHSGERVVTADIVRDGGDEGDVHLHVTTPTEVLDPKDVGRQLAFYRKHG